MIECLKFCRFVFKSIRYEIVEIWPKFLPLSYFFCTRADWAIAFTSHCVSLQAAITFSVPVVVSVHLVSILFALYILHFCMRLILIIVYAVDLIDLKFALTALNLFNCHCSVVSWSDEMRSTFNQIWNIISDVLSEWTIFGNRPLHTPRFIFPFVNGVKCQKKSWFFSSFLWKVSLMQIPSAIWINQPIQQWRVCLIQHIQAHRWRGKMIICKIRATKYYEVI